ncbi:hypothetical protein JHK82_033825 [Glycine max]|nr:hypothetical protein JHK87_033766 [Glycine soja]KAG4980582.1 hypothetical protein JHK85_034540 [Glycine max]KAG4986215.1 hypothetical protein JHK86_033906 [Glycine max]KAG5119405.1 hypothetical protein JHK82_033825 [Glycine max]KAG5140396.1 hypothetical protein JHK84_034164 [Glycine max]
MPTPSKLQLEANAILKNGWWNRSQSDTRNICGMHLNLSRNYLDGAIPLSLGNLILLQSLVISSNIVQGSIPRELVSLKNLTILDLSHNKINATLPITLVKPCMANKHSNLVTTSSTTHALSYLHHGCTPPIMHRDISTNNVLVNSEWDYCYICPTLNVYFAGKKKKARNQIP